MRPRAGFLLARMHLSASIFFHCGESSSSHIYIGLLLGTAAWAAILARFQPLLRFGSELFLGVQPHFRRESHPGIPFPTLGRALSLLICLVSTPNLTYYFSD